MVALGASKGAQREWRAKVLKVDAKTLFESFQGLQELATQKISGNAKLAYNLGKTLKCVKTEIEQLQAQEIGIFKEFGGVEIPGGGVKIPEDSLTPEKQKEFDQARKDLLAVEVELWGSEITLDELEKGKVELSAGQCSVLSWLIRE